MAAFPYFFDALPETWLYVTDQVTAITKILNSLRNPAKFVYYGLKSTIVGLDPSAFNDTNSTVTVQALGDYGHDGIIDGGTRLNPDSLFDSGFRI